MAEVDEQVDRFSNLSDTLLYDILSLLSTKEAVATSILSKRWISVWTKVPVLELSLDYGTSAASAKGFKAFVDRVLICNESPTLRLFQLSAISKNKISDFYYHSWIRNIMRRGVVEINLSLDRGTLPAGSFSSETLKVLKLNGFESPLPDLFHLPNLVTLHFTSINVTDELLFKDFLMSLPRLEELVIKNRKDIKNTCICSSSLKRLTLIEYFQYPRKIVKDTIVDAPSLEYLHIEDFSSDYKFGNMLSLEEVKLYVRHYQDPNDNVRVINLLTQVSNLKTFKLVVESTMDHYGYIDLHQLPLFPNLIHLVVEFSWWIIKGSLSFSFRKLVLCILQRAPNIVSFDYETCSLNEIEHVERLKCPIPTLEAVNVRLLRLSTADKRLLEYLLDNAINLKVLRINLKGELNDEKMDAITWLFKVPRTSSVCKLVVSHQK